MKQITTIITYGKRFTIYKDDHGFWGLTDDQIETHSTINGIQGRLSDTLDDCLFKCTFEACVQHMIAQGSDPMASLQAAYTRMQDAGWRMWVDCERV